jgi:hypothetical protein
MAQFQNKQMQMQREHSDMDMNGHRPQSPSSAENAPSPSKRPRLEGGQAVGQQMAPNGRPQGQMPGQMNPQAMLMQNGINPRGMNPAQFQAFQQAGSAAQKQSIQGMPNGLMNTGQLMPNQNDLMQQMPDGQSIQMMNGQFYNGEMGVRPGMPPNGQSGNHALQDYQMQLMLLEQQNKRRLMMARQEQDSMTRPDGQPIPGQPGLPPGTSPQGSRTGASPNPSEQMKRGTPKIPQSGLPGSPNPGDMQGRGSPASMNFNGGQIPPDMNTSFFMKPNDAMVAPNGMRPPTSNQGGFNPQMNQAMQQPGPNNRMPGANWPTPQAQGMVPQQSPAAQAAPTPEARNAMPPPSAPPVGGKPASPQQAPAPPTPQQSNKPAPKKKGGDTEKNRKRPAKKTNAAAVNANTAATPSSETEPPPTPTPSTPITPQHPNSFTKNVANATTTAQQPTSAPAPMVQQQPDPNPTGFGDLGMPDPSNFSLDFAALENPEILENFDFDSFLNTDADAAGFGFDPSITYSTDGVETGTDGL